MIKSSHYLLLFALMLSVQNMFSQPLPAMHVFKKYSEPRIKNFFVGTHSKFNTLKKINPAQEKTFIYSNTSIRDLIKKIPDLPGIGLRVYFAMYDKASNTNMPATVEEKKVVLIFSYSYMKEKIKDAKYYFIDDKDGDNPVIEINDISAVNRWIVNYNSYCQDVLRGGLIINDDDNIDTTETSGKKYDTKSIFYNIEDLVEATTQEESYPHLLKTIPISISAYQFSFSAYDRSGKPYDPGKHRWRNRMQLEIDYMYKKAEVNTVFYLEELDSFAERSKEVALLYLAKLNPVKQKFWAPNGVKKLSVIQINKILSYFSIDNGQLCPTYCPK